MTKGERRMTKEGWGRTQECRGPKKGRPAQPGMPGRGRKGWTERQKGCPAQSRAPDRGWWDRQVRTERDGRAGGRRRGRRQRRPRPRAMAKPGISGWNPEIRRSGRQMTERPIPHPAAAPAGPASNPVCYSFSSLPYFAASIAASLRLALRYWVCEVFSVMPSICAISRWEYPSRQKRLNTAR